MIKSFILLCTVLFIQMANAASGYTIVGLKAVVQKVAEKSTQVQTLIPDTFPILDKQYYAYLETAEQQRYLVRLSTKECAGAQDCSIAEFSAEVGANPTIYHNMENVEMTRPVFLKNNIKAYYSYGFDIAGHQSPQIELRCKSALYKISWGLKSDDDTKTLINLFNSAIDKGYCETRAS